MKIALNNFYYFGTCHYCKITSPQLKRCSSCRTVAYCTKEHQKLDWINHRELCKVIAFTLINDAEVPNFKTYKEWTNYRVNMQRKWLSLLKRPLQPFECQMWMFPRVCNWCYSQSDLNDCIQCYNVAYCSTHHRECDKPSHKLYCNSLRLCMNIDRYLITYRSYPEIDLQRIVSNLTPLPEDMEQLLNLMYRKSDGTEESRIQKALMSEMLSLGTILVYTMQALFKNPACKSKCVIHLVGAAAAEASTDWKLSSEIILHAFENIFEISFYLIGPEAWEMHTDFDLCQVCNLRGKKVSFAIRKGLYHDIVINIPKADMVIAFNCGLHEFEGKDSDNWRLSIPFIMTDIPFVYTSYTKEEMVKDLEYLKKIIPDIKKSYIIMHGKNPFSSLRPLRDWCTKNNPIFYSNSYITIMKKL